MSSTYLCEVSLLQYIHTTHTDTQAGVKLYFTEISAIVLDALTGSSWTLREHAGHCIVKTCQILTTPVDGIADFSSIVSATLVALKGQYWSGKEILLKAVVEPFLTKQSVFFSAIVFPDRYIFFIQISRC